MPKIELIGELCLAGCDPDASGVLIEQCGECVAEPGAVAIPTPQVTIPAPGDEPLSGADEDFSKATDCSAGEGIGHELLDHPDVSQLTERDAAPSMETIDNRLLPDSQPQGKVHPIPLPRTLESEVRRARFKEVLDRHSFKLGSPPGRRKVRLELEEMDPEDLEVGADDNLVLVLVEDRLLNTEPLQIEPPSGTPPVQAVEFEKAYPAYYANFNPDLKPSLRQFRADISRSACDFYAVEKDRTNAPYHMKASVVKAKVLYKNRHEDGLTVLAMRRLFQDLKERYHNFRGVVLVGAFPEALLMRRWLEGGWTKSPADSPYYYEYTQRPIAEEILAFRSDIVLADLDGYWEDIYHRGPETFLMSPADGADLGGKAMGVGGEKWVKDKVEDYFLIDEVHPTALNQMIDPEVGHPDVHGERWDQSERGYKAVNTHNGEYVHPGLLYRSRRWNSSKFDHAQVGNERYEYYHKYLKKGLKYKDNPYGLHVIRNPIATPDILVSRINARHVAQSVNPLYIKGKKAKRWYWDLKLGDPCDGATGLKKLASTLKISTGVTVRFTDMIVRDPYLERELLIDYFARNHAYRGGKAGVEEIGAVNASKKHKGGDEGDTWGHDRMSPPIEHQRAFRKYWTEDKNAPVMRDADNKKNPVTGPLIAFQKVDASYEDALDWLRVPALLREYHSHGSAHSLDTTTEYQCAPIKVPAVIATPLGPMYVGHKMHQPDWNFRKRPLYYWDMREVYEQLRAGVFRRDRPGQKPNASFYYTIASYNSAPMGARLEPYNSDVVIGDWTLRLNEYEDAPDPGKS